MEKEKTKQRRSRVNLNDLSPRDLDIISLATADVMKKYKVEKQPVYDRRFALKKRLQAAGLTIEQILLANDKNKNATKGGQDSNAGTENTDGKKSESIPEVKRHEGWEPHVSANQQVIAKPIEVNFNHFSIRINGVPTRISVNTDSNVIEIDL